MGMQEDVQDIKKVLASLQQNAEEKKFKFPFGKKVGKGQKKKNYVTILIMHENGTYDFKKYQIEDQTIVHDDIPRLASAGHVMFDKKGNPLIVLPNWSVEPFSPLDHFKNSLVNGQNTAGYKLLMAKMQKELIGSKKKISGIVGWIAGLGLMALIAYALISGGAG